MADRVTAAAQLAAHLGAWGGLAATEERETATELLGAAVLLGPPKGLAWHVMAQFRLENDVVARLRHAARSGARPGPGPGSDARAFPSEELLLGSLGELAGGLRDHNVDASAVQRAVRGLVELQIDTLFGEEPAFSWDPMVVALSAAWLLDVPAAGSDASIQHLREELLGVAADAVARDIVELRRGTVDVEGAFWAEGEDDEEQALDELPDIDQLGNGEDDDEESELPLGRTLRALDRRLRVTDDPAEGAGLAYGLGCLLLVAAASGLSDDPVPLGLADRVRAASWVAARGVDEPPDDLERAGEELHVAPALQRAAALLTVDQPPVPDPESTTEEQLRRLDQLVEHCGHPDVFPSECVVADGLAYAAAATEALHVGAALSAAAGVPCDFAGALAVLDPSALAAYPELRAQAAAQLRDAAAETASGGT